MSGLLAGPRLAVRLARRVSFRLWAIKLDVVLRLHGGRLDLDAPHGARLGTWPRLDVRRRGRGAGVFTLSIGPNVSFGHDVVLEVWSTGGDSSLAIGEHSLIHDGVRFQIRHGRVRLGKRVQLRELVVLKCEGELDMHDYAAIGYAATVHCKERVEFGTNAAVAERSSIIDSDHTFNKDAGFMLDSPVLAEPIVLGPFVFVGANVVLLRGVRLGAHSVVAAGSVVRGGDYPEAWLIAGVPARPRAALGEPEPSSSR